MQSCAISVARKCLEWLSGACKRCHASKQGCAEAGRGFLITHSIPTTALRLLRLVRFLDFWLADTSLSWTGVFSDLEHDSRRDLAG